jgi:hypothetical protein
VLRARAKLTFCLAGLISSQQSAFSCQLKNPQSEIRNPKSHIPHLTSQIRNPKSEIRNPKSHIPHLTSQIPNSLAPCTFPAFAAFLAFLYRLPFTVYHLRLQRFQRLQRFIGRYALCALRYAITSCPTHREEFYSGAERIRALNTLS